MTRIGIAALVAGLIASAAPARAGSPYRVDPPGGRPAADPAASGVPNVPDLQGCVKWCRRDQNPCDPPIFKRADGRCAFLD